MKTVLWPRSFAVLVLAGWMVLCQHVACGQTEYAGDGEPTAKEEEIRWLINRSRFSRSKENARRGSNYLDIPASSGPIAPNGRLTLAARRHAEDLATRNLFQHTTVPGSAYYDPSTHPNSWDRMTAEGYVWNLAGENIAAGYPSAGSVYVGWWHSTGHRLNMFNRNFTEIGNGHFFRAASTYKDYYAMSLGRSGSNRFFTGTLFQDLNGNKGYNQGEGRGGVKVELVVGGAKHSVCDTSTAVGSFAIPLAGIAEGETVRVVLTNTTNESITVSVPRNYDVLESIVMGPSESRPWGQFVRANDDLNYGFSDVGVPVEFIVLLPSEGEHGAESGIGYTFAVAANVAWTSSSNSTWLRVTGGQTGTDVGTVTYEMDANPFGDPRVGLISLIGDANVVKTFQVTQAGLPTTLGVNPTEMNVGSDGGSGLGITVNANVTWRATKTVHWIQFSGGSEAVGDGTLGLNVSPNTGSVAREAVVTIRGGSETRLVTVRQEAGAVRRVGETFALNASEGAGTVQKVSGLPSGVVFDRLTGQITGRPTQAGIFLVKMDVLGVGGVEKRVLTLTVSALPVSAVGSFEMGLARAAGLGNGLGGVLNFTTTTSGSVSGTLRMVGKTHSWRGLVEHATGMAPEVVATVLRSKEEPVTLRITLNSDHRATGAATPGAAGVAVGVEGWKRVWAIRTAEVSPAMVGSMNVLFDLKAAWENDISVPQGSGYAVMTVAKDGRLTWSGRMPDGAVLVRSGWLGPSGEGAFWSALHGVQGSVMGGGVCAINGTFTGNLDWVKKGPASSSDRTYASGFGVDMRGPVGLTMFGEIWQTPAKGLALLDVLGLSEGPENLQLEFVGGVQADTVAPVADLRPTLTRQNKLNLPIPGDVGNPNRVIVRIYPTSGRVTGEFTLTDAPIGGIGAPVKRQVFFNGLKLPKSVEAGGYFLGRKRVTAPQPTEMLSGAIWMTK